MCLVLLLLTGGMILTDVEQVFRTAALSDISILEHPSAEKGGRIFDPKNTTCFSVTQLSCAAAINQGQIETAFDNRLLWLIPDCEQKQQQRLSEAGASSYAATLWERARDFASSDVRTSWAFTRMEVRASRGFRKFDWTEHDEFLGNVWIT